MTKFIMNGKNFSNDAWRVWPYLMFEKLQIVKFFVHCKKYGYNAHRILADEIDYVYAYAEVSMAEYPVAYVHVKVYNSHFVQDRLVDQITVDLRYCYHQVIGDGEWLL